MIKILFVCHGNICRSPMAEFVMKDLVEKAGLSDQFEIASAATSREELGNPVHSGTRAKLGEFGISTKGKTARQMTKEDYKYYDYIIAMDTWNVKNINRIIGADLEHKVSMLLSTTAVFSALQILRCRKAIFLFLLKKQRILTLQKIRCFRNCL